MGLRMLAVYVVLLTFATISVIQYTRSQLFAELAQVRQRAAATASVDSVLGSLRDRVGAIESAIPADRSWASQGDLIGISRAYQRLGKSIDLLYKRFEEMNENVVQGRLRERLTAMEERLDQGLALQTAGSPDEEKFQWSAIRDIEQRMRHLFPPTKEDMGADQGTDTNPDADAGADGQQQDDGDGVQTMSGTDVVPAGPGQDRLAVADADDDAAWGEGMRAADQDFGMSRDFPVRVQLGDPRDPQSAVVRLESAEQSLRGLADQVLSLHRALTAMEQAGDPDGEHNAVQSYSNVDSYSSLDTKQERATPVQSQQQQPGSDAQGQKPEQQAQQPGQQSEQQAQQPEQQAQQSTPEAQGQQPASEAQEPQNEWVTDDDADESVRKEMQPPVLRDQPANPSLRRRWDDNW